jgi:hypothetical protein
LILVFENISSNTILSLFICCHLIGMASTIFNMIIYNYHMCNYIVSMFGKILDGALLDHLCNVDPEGPLACVHTTDTNQEVKEEYSMHLLSPGTQSTMLTSRPPTI